MPPVSEFNIDAMQNKHHSHGDTYKVDGEIRRLIGELRKLALSRQTSNKAEKLQEPRTTSINLSRNIQFASDEVLDQEALVSLAQIYNADQKLADEISAGLHVACQPSSTCSPRRRSSNSQNAETDKGNNAEVYVRRVSGNTDQSAARLNGTKSLARSAVREMLVQ